LAASRALLNAKCAKYTTVKAFEDMVLKASCVGCHDQDHTDTGIKFDAPIPAQMVDKAPRVVCKKMKLVDVKMPDRSVLLHKLLFADPMTNACADGDPMGKARMPMDDDPLAPEMLDCFGWYVASLVKQAGGTIPPAKP
jgi:hypothetical protein